MKHQRIHRDAKKRSGRALWAHPGGGVDSGPGPVLLPRPAPGPGHGGGGGLPRPGAGVLHRRALSRPAGEVPHRLRERLRGDGPAILRGGPLRGGVLSTITCPWGTPPTWTGRGITWAAIPGRLSPGSPYEESGWGCYSPVIEKALVRALEDSGRKDLAVARLDGSTLEDLYGRYVSQEVPVLLWGHHRQWKRPVVSQTFTIQGTGEAFDWVYPMHCLLWVGEAGDSWLFHDPPGRGGGGLLQVPR